MRPRTLLILFIVVLALAAFIRFYEHDQPGSDERAARAKHVLDVKADQVTRVAIDSGGTTVVLQRASRAGGGGSGSQAKLSGGDSGLSAVLGGAGGAGAPAATSAGGADWSIVSPLAARADSAAVGALVDSLANLDKTRTLDTVVPAEVGLDRPRATVTLTVQGESKPIVLKVGAAVPTGGEMVVGVAGRSEAYAVGDGLLADLQKKAGDWRDHQLFHGDRDAIERISWTTGAGPRLVLAKRGDAFWLESPVADRADREQVEKLLTDLTGLTADRYLDPPLPPRSELGLDPPRTVVEAVLAGQPAPFRVELGNSRSVAAPPAEPGAPATNATVTYGRSGSNLFETRSPLLPSLARPPADWRSPQLSGVEVHQLDSAVIREAGSAQPVVLTRAGTDWKRGAVTISYLPVSDLLFAATEAKADRLLTPAEAQSLGAAQGPPLLTFDLKAGQAGNETLTLYPPLTGATQGVPAKATGRDTVLLLPAAKLKDIQDRLQAVRTAPPLAPEKPAAKSAGSGT